MFTRLLKRHLNKLHVKQYSHAVLFLRRFIQVNDKISTEDTGNSS